MKSRFRSLCVVSAVLSLASCDKPTPPAAAAPVTTEADNQLAEARDALQRQALEIETKTALMDKQLAEMEQSLKDRDNAELRGSLDTLKRQNEALRVQADAARQQSNAITQRITVTPPPNVAPQPMALPDYSMFYQQLAPFGRWFEVNGYGFCWRPTITVAGWRPYVDGCWVWTSLGWAWQSNEPFGWATYHYGRWVNLARYGWVWVPGSEWAPAWVAWRQSRDCVGWAPLPPEQGVCSGVYRDCDSRYGLGPASYTFINTNQFVSSSYINVYAPVIRQTTIYQHSVNVTQIVPGHGREHAFVHQGGPPRAQMEQACGQPVPQRQVQTMHADQVPAHQQHHGHRDAAAPVAMVELPAVTPGVRVMHPEVKEHIQRPVQMSGFEGVPQQAATEIRETIAREKETAAVQQQPVHGHTPHQAPRHPGEAPAVVNGAPSVPNAPPQETVRPASPAEKPVLAGENVTTAAVQPQPGHERMPHESPRHSVEAPAVSSVIPMTNAPTQETVRPAVAAEPGTAVAREHKHHGDPVVAPAPASLPLETKTVEGSAPAVAPATQPAPTLVTAPPAVMPQPPAEASVSQQPVANEKMAAEPGTAAASAEAERARMQAAREEAHGAAMEQRQQQAMQERAMAEKRAAEQAAANAEAEKSRMQAAAAQQEALAAQQQRMAADQAAAETEKARQQAATAAAQQQQEMAAQQQRMAADQAAAETEKARQQAATAAAQQQQEMASQQQRAAAERMAADQAAAAEADRVRLQTEAAAMQRQQEEATRRAAAEQQMRAQQETERRTQEMAAQRQAEEQVRRQQEAETQRAQEQARRAAEEQQMRAQQEAAQRAQEMAQRQAEEQVRRQQEAEMQRAQEQARRAAEEQQMRAQQEAAQRAQEMAQRQAEEQARRAQEQAQRQAEEQARRAQEQAQRQAEEQARRAQEEAQRAAAEAAQRAAAEAARNQPQPAPGS